MEFKKLQIMKVLQLTWFLLCYDVHGLIKTPSLYWQQKKLREPPPPLMMRFYPNKWQGVIISLQTGGQGHQTSIHTPTLTHTHKHTQTNIKNARFPTFWLDHYGQMNQQTDGQIDKASYRVACQQLQRPSMLHQGSGWGSKLSKFCLRHFRFQNWFLLLPKR